MSYQRGNGQNGGHYYSNITQPVRIDCQFTVDSTNTNGLGLKSLKSNGYIQSIYMHTSATPASGSPNPASGYAVIRFKSNYNVSLGEFVSIASPNSGSDLTSTVSGNAYIITALGTATLAQWQAAGVPAGFTPAVGLSFIAKATATIGGSATVKVPGVSGISGVEVVGDPSQSIANSQVFANSGAQMVVQFLGATNSSTTTLIPKAPADGSVVSMSFLFDLSSVSIDGL